MTNESHRILCFDPIVGSNPKILILGTMPGMTSIKENMYYASGRNHFWDFIYRILIPEYPHYKVFDTSIPKEKRYSLITSNSIAVWDVVLSCTRIGSNDKNIKDEQFNDIVSFVHKFKINTIICNGALAFKFLRKSKQHKSLNIPIITLNSTSSLNPNNTFEVLNEWMTCLREQLIKNQ